MLRALTARSGRSVPRDSIVGRQTHLVQLSGLIKTYIGGWGMPEVDDQFSHIVPGAAAKADQFLRVVRDRCNNMQIGLTLEAAQRSRRDGGGQCLKGDLGSGQGIEVFADPMGPGLHVGFQLTIVAPWSAARWRASECLGISIVVMHDGRTSLATCGP